MTEPKVEREPTKEERAILVNGFLGPWVSALKRYGYWGNIDNEALDKIVLLIRGERGSKM